MNNNQYAIFFTDYLQQGDYSKTTIKGYSTEVSKEKRKTCITKHH